MHYIVLVYLCEEHSRGYDWIFKTVNKNKKSFYCYNIIWDVGIDE